MSGGEYTLHILYHIYIPMSYYPYYTFYSFFPLSKSYTYPKLSLPSYCTSPFLQSLLLTDITTSHSCCLTANTQHPCSFYFKVLNKHPYRQHLSIYKHPYYRCYPAVLTNKPSSPAVPTTSYHTDPTKQSYYLSPYCILYLTNHKIELMNQCE